MIALRRFLPLFYVAGFVDPEERVEGTPAVWVHRPVIGVFHAAPVDPFGTGRHFNDVVEPALLKNEDLERLLAAIEDDASRIVRDVLPSRAALSSGRREVLATFFALLGIRLSSRFGDLDEAEARHALLRAHRFVLAPKPAIPG